MGGLLPVLLLLLLFFVDIPICPTKNLFGFPCPGCGLTRATEAMVGGDLYAALALHPLLPLILPIVGWMFLRIALVSARLLPTDSYDPLARMPLWFWAAFVVLLVGVWVARLAGLMGGHPDPIDFQSGLIGRVIELVRNGF